MPGGRLWIRFFGSVVNREFLHTAIVFADWETQVLRSVNAQAKALSYFYDSGDCVRRTVTILWHSLSNEDRCC